MVSPCGRRPRVEGPPTPSPHHRGACPATIQPWRPALVCVLLGAPRAVSSAGCTEALRGGYRAGALTLVSGAGAEAEGGAGPSTGGPRCGWGAQAWPLAAPRLEDIQVRTPRACPAILAGPTGLPAAPSWEPSPTLPLTGSTGQAGPAEWGMQARGRLPRAPAGLHLALLVRRVALGRQPGLGCVQRTRTCCWGSSRTAHPGGQPPDVPHPGAGLLMAPPQGLASWWALS